jgi:hypothetical protein
MRIKQPDDSEGKNPRKGEKIWASKSFPTKWLQFHLIRSKSRKYFREGHAEKHLRDIRAMLEVSGE